MSSNTGGGDPYPLPTAPVRDGANDLKALALAVDSRAGTLVECKSSGTVSVASGSWLAVPVPTLSYERDPLGLITTDSNSPVTAAAGAGWWDILVQVIWAGSAAGRRITGWHTSTGGSPSTWAQTANAPNNGGVFTVAHRDLVYVPGGSRILPWAYQDSGATLAVNGCRLVARFVSAQTAP